MSKVGTSRLFVVFIASLVIVLSAYLLVKWLKQVGFIPIEVVTLTDKLQHADPQEIKVAVMPFLKAGFWGLEVGKIRNELKKVAWIADANVQRNWPNTVKIKIFERQPMAIWQGTGIIDTEGRLFFPNNIASLHNLPAFVGSEHAVDAMVDTYLLMMSTLKPIGLTVNKLELMTDQGWRAMLDNGITIIVGQIELEERLKRFVWAYNSLQTGEQKIKVVDLRYTNGLSVG